MAVKVVTDSVSDLPPDLAASYGISIVPAKVLFGTEQFSDGVDITTDEFFQRLASSPTLPTTSQPSVGDFVQGVRQCWGGRRRNRMRNVLLQGERNLQFRRAGQG